MQRAMRHTGRSFIPTPLSVATKNDLTARKLRVTARAIRARENAIKVTQAGSLHIVKTQFVAGYSKQTILLRPKGSNLVVGAVRPRSDSIQRRRSVIFSSGISLTTVENPTYPALASEFLPANPISRGANIMRTSLFSRNLVP